MISRNDNDNSKGQRALSVARHVKRNKIWCHPPWRREQVSGECPSRQIKKTQIARATSRDAGVQGIEKKVQGKRSGAVSVSFSSRIPAVVSVGRVEYGSCFSGSIKLTMV